jgi:hypothetical protein
MYPKPGRYVSSGIKGLSMLSGVKNKGNSPIKTLNIFLVTR